MDTNNKGNFTLRTDEVSKRKTNQHSSKCISIKKALLAIAVVAITSGTYAQVNEPESNKSQDLKNKNTLDKNYQQSPDVSHHPDGYIMKNGKVMMIQNGQLTQLDKDVTLSNGTTISKDGSYLMQGGTKTMFKEGEHMDLMGKVNPMDKSKNYHRSEVDNPSRKDTMNWNNDSTRKPVKTLSPSN